MPTLTLYTEEDTDTTTLDLSVHPADESQELVAEARARAQQGDLIGAEFCLQLAGVLP